MGKTTRMSPNALLLDNQQCRSLYLQTVSTYFRSDFHKMILKARRTILRTNCHKIQFKLIQIWILSFSCRNFSKFRFNRYESKMSIRKNNMWYWTNLVIVSKKLFSGNKSTFYSIWSANNEKIAPYLLFWGTTSHFWYIKTEFMYLCTGHPWLWLY